jgi:hypothetical protein
MHIVYSLSASFIGQLHCKHNTANVCVFVHIHTYIHTYILNTVHQVKSLLNRIVDISRSEVQGALRYIS